MFPWQPILETALTRNGAIQLSNDVTVTLFLNQSLQTFEVFLEMISGTSVQNFSRKKCFILSWLWWPRTAIVKISKNLNNLKI